MRELQFGEQRLVEEADPPLAVEHHYAGLRTVQRLAGAGVVARDGALGLDPLAQPLLHVAQARGQLADLIVRIVDGQHGVEPVIGDVLGKAQRIADRLTDRAQHQQQRGDQHHCHQQQGKCEYDPHGAGPRGLSLACRRQGPRLRLLQRLQPGPDLGRGLGQ